MKLEAKDLRIGNYVYYNDKVISIAPMAINEFFVLGNTHSESLTDRRDYKPIQLTEDWVKKIEVTIKENTRLFFSNFSNDADGFFVWVSGFKLYIKYLHQLQNLYYALTGEELTIKTE